MRTLLVCVAGLLLAGCGQSTSAPPPLGVHLDLAITPTAADPANPATISAAVSNDGPARVRNEGCSYAPGGMTLQFLDPAGKEVFLSDPRIRPLCADGLTDFRRGERFEATFLFEGELFEESGTKRAAATGDYTVIVRVVTYADAQRNDALTLERRAQFRWASP